MIRLALTLAASPAETPTGYLSRLAARNLSPDMQVFSEDCDLDFPALATGDSEAVAHLCAIAGLPPGSFAGRTVVKTSTMKYRVGAEVMNTETLSRGALRYCPSCVLHALVNGARPWGIVHPLHWQFIHVRRCDLHGTLLHSSRPPTDRTPRFDFTLFVRETSIELMQEQSSDAGIADALDFYLTRRAYGEHGDNWCNRLEIPALIKACEAIGTLIGHGRHMRASSLSNEQRRDAMQTGFNILSQGRQGIRQALDQFSRRTPTRGGNQPHPRYGELQRLLGSHCKLRTDLDPLRDIVREYLLDHYPFRPGTTVLGRQIAKSRVFSIRGACREIGVRRSLLEEILIRRRLAHRDDGKSFQLDGILTRALVHDIRREKSDYLDQKQTAAFLGCSFAMFKQLQHAGILRPADGDGRWMRKGFNRPALQAFLNQLGREAGRAATPTPHLCSLELATRKANCSVPDIIKLMLDGKLRARARLTDDIRLDSLLISAEELACAFGRHAPNGYSLSAVQRHLYINAATAAWLIEHGYLAIRRFRHNITRVTRDFVTAESVARFEKSYMTPGRYAHERGIPAPKASALLRGAGLHPIHVASGLRPIYLRADVAAAFSESEG